MLATRTLILLFGVLGFAILARGIPVSSEDESTSSSSSSEESNETLSSNSTNSTAKDLYVIKTVVYEVGILTDVAEDDNSTSNETETQEKVDLTFYDAHSNGSHINLGDIPLPVQTNISGQVYTSLASVDAASFSKSVANSLSNLGGANGTITTVPIVSVTKNVSYAGPPPKGLVPELTKIPVHITRITDADQANTTTTSTTEEP